MPDNLEKIVDECLDRMSGGESLEACLRRYPGYRRQLEPLLRTALRVQRAYSFEPLASARNEARKHFNAVLKARQQARLRRIPFSNRVSFWPKAITAATVVLVMLLAGYFGFRQFLWPDIVPPVVQSPLPNAEGNFVFFISDEVNAIGDFSTLNVTVDNIGLQPEGDAASWLEFAPEISEVDLTLLQGDSAEAIWRGNIPRGKYNQVFIYVASVKGVLKESGETIEIKLPSGKLHLNNSFQVADDSVTSFTYDISVVATGNPQGKYVLTPQVGASGASSTPRPPPGKANK